MHVRNGLGRPPVCGKSGRAGRGTASEKKKEKNKENKKSRGESGPVRGKGTRRRRAKDRKRAEGCGTRCDLARQMTKGGEEGERVIRVATKATQKKRVCCKSVANRPGDTAAARCGGGGAQVGSLNNGSSGPQGGGRGESMRPDRWQLCQAFRAPRVRAFARAQSPQLVAELRGIAHRLTRSFLRLCADCEFEAPIEKPPAAPAAKGSCPAGAAPKPPAAGAPGAPKPPGAGDWPNAKACGCAWGWPNAGGAAAGAPNPPGAGG